MILRATRTRLHFARALSPRERPDVAALPFEAPLRSAPQGEGTEGGAAFCHSDSDVRTSSSRERPDAAEPTPARLRCAPARQAPARPQVSGGAATASPDNHSGALPSPLVGEGGSAPAAVDDEPRRRRAETDEGCSSLVLRPTPLIRRCAPPSPTGGEGRDAGVALTIELTPCVALILRLVCEARNIDAGEAIGRGICIYAEQIGVPALARATFDSQDIRE